MPESLVDKLLKAKGFEAKSEEKVQSDNPLVQKLLDAKAAAKKETEVVDKPVDKPVDKTPLSPVPQTPKIPRIPASFSNRIGAVTNAVDKAKQEEKAADPIATVVSDQEVIPSLIGEDVQPIQQYDENGLDAYPQQQLQTEIAPQLRPQSFDETDKAAELKRQGEIAIKNAQKKDRIGGTDPMSQAKLSYERNRDITDAERQAKEKLEQAEKDFYIGDEAYQRNLEKVTEFSQSYPGDTEAEKIIKATKDLRPEQAKHFLSNADKKGFPIYEGLDTVQEEIDAINQQIKNGDISQDAVSDQIFDLQDKKENLEAAKSRFLIDRSKSYAEDQAKIRKLIENGKISQEDGMNEIQFLEDLKTNFFKPRDEQVTNAVQENSKEITELVNKKVVPEDATPEEALNIYYNVKYQQALDLHEKLGYGGDFGLINQIVGGGTDIVTGQNDYEEEYRKLDRELRSLSSIVMFNRAPVLPVKYGAKDGELKKKKSGNLLALLGKSGLKVLAPAAVKTTTTREDTARDVQSAIAETNIGGAVKDGNIAQVDDWAKMKNWTARAAIQTTGTSLGFMLPFAAMGGTTSSAGKFNSLLGKIDDLANTDRIVNASSRFKQLALKSKNSLVKIMASGAEGAIDYGVIGLVFQGVKDEANVPSGLFGATGGKVTQEMVEGIVGVFGKKAPQFVGLVANLLGRGAGEVTEESAQEFVSLVKENGESDKFFKNAYDLFTDSGKRDELKEAYKERFPTASDRLWFATNTFIMGALFNAGSLAQLFESKNKEAVAALTPEEKKAYDEIVLEASEETSALLERSVDAELEATFDELGVDRAEVKSEVKKDDADRKDLSKATESLGEGKSEQDVLTDELQSEIESVTGKKEKVVTGSTEGISLQKYNEANGIEDGTILVNGIDQSDGYILKEGDVITESSATEQNQDNSEGVSASVEAEPTVSEGDGATTEEKAKEEVEETPVEATNAKEINARKENIKWLESEAKKLDAKIKKAEGQSSTQTDMFNGTQTQMGLGGVDTQKLKFEKAKLKEKIKKEKEWLDQNIEGQTKLDIKPSKEIVQPPPPKPKVEEKKAEKPKEAEPEVKVEKVESNGKSYEIERNADGEAVRITNEKGISIYPSTSRTFPDGTSKSVGNPAFTKKLKELTGEMSDNQIKQEFEDDFKSAAEGEMSTAYEIVRVLFGGGGTKLNRADVIKEMLVNGKATSKDYNWITGTDESLQTMRGLAEDLALEYADTYNISEEDFFTAIEDVLGGFESTQDIKRSVVEDFRELRDFENRELTEEEARALMTEEELALLDMVAEDTNLTEQEKEDYYVQEYFKQFDALSDADKQKFYEQYETDGLSDTSQSNDEGNSQESGGKQKQKVKPKSSGGGTGNGGTGTTTENESEGEKPFEPFPVSATNAYTRASRLARGADPIIKAAKQKMKDVFEAVEAKIISGEINPRDRVREMADFTERRISVEDQAIALYDRVRIAHEKRIIEDQLKKARDEGNDLAEAQSWARLAELELEARVNDVANTNVGEEWGRLGAFRQSLVTEDYTLINIKNQIDMLTGGRRLTAKEERRIEDLLAQLNEALDKNSELREKIQEIENQRDINEEEIRAEIEEELIAKIEKEHAAKEAKKDSSIKEKGKRIAAKIRAAKLKNNKTGFTFSTIVPPPVIDGAMEVIATAVEAGASIASAINEGIKWIKYKQPKFWNGLTAEDQVRFKDKFGNYVKDSVGKEEKVAGPEAVDAEINQQEFDALIEELIITADGEFHEGLSGILYKITKNRVIGGNRTIDGIVKDIYEAIKNEIPGVTEREIRDGISGYGKFTKLSRDEINVAIRELKRQGRLDSSLDDVANDQLPLRSGMERDQKSKETRDKEAKLAKEIRDKGLVPEPTAEEIAGHWKSAEDAYIRKLERAIEDVQKEIDTSTKKERSPKKKFDSPKVVNLQKQLEVLKKLRDDKLNGPPKTQLEKDTEAKHKQLNKAIEKVKEEIANRAKAVKEPAKKLTDPETIRLQAELEGLREVRDELLNPPKKTPEQKRFDSVKRSTEKAIADLNKAIQDLKDNNPITGKNVTISTKDGKSRFGLTKPRPESIVDAEIQQLQDLKEALKDELHNLLPESIKQKALLDKYKKQRQRRLEQLEEKKRTRDYGPKKVADKPILDRETKDINREIERLKFAIDKEMEEIRLSELKGWEKFKEKAIDIFNLPKALIASVDLSAPLRQGVLFVGKPKLFTKALIEMMQHAFSQKAHENWLLDLKSTDVYVEMLENGLFIAEPTARLAAKEEQFMSNFLKYAYKIPIYGQALHGSERAYVGFLNKIRTDAYMSFRNQLERDGFSGEEMQTELKSYANFLNVASGRGKLGKTLEPISPLLNSLFFSPRLIASRLTLLLNFNFYRNLSDEARKDALKTVFGFLSIGIMTTVLANLGADDDDKVELDMRSSDFGKIKRGNKRYDIWGGFQQPIRALAQFATGVKKSSNTDKYSALSKKNFPNKTRATVAWDFFKYKLSPSAALVLGLADDYTSTIGEEITLTNAIVEKVLPLYISDMEQIIHEEGLGAGLVSAVPPLLGVGISYQGTDRQKVRREIDKAKTNLRNLERDYKVDKNLNKVDSKTLSDYRKKIDKAKEKLREAEKKQKKSWFQKLIK